MKAFLSKYKHAWVLSYTFLYLAWFFWLESRTNVVYRPIHTHIDDLIPFSEFFVIPYFLWFAYVAVSVLYFFFTSKEDYYRTTAFLFIGMTICLIIYTIWPNCQNLRPAVLPRDNFLSRLVIHLYGVDTSTNVCPSIHVYNSIGVHIAVCHSNRLKSKKWVRITSAILMISICMSTVFLKQHSFFDGVCAGFLAVIMYAFVYVPSHAHLLTRKQRRQHTQTE